MRKFFNQISSIAFFCLLLIIVSCNDQADTPRTDTPASTDSNNRTDVSPGKTPAAALIGGTLDTLWISSTDFPATPEKIVFSFTIDEYDELKMHGWKVKGGPNQFDTNPNYLLINAGQHNGGTYGPNMYFGNLVLQQNEVQAIRIKINQGGYTKVLFVPGVTDGHIGYKIFVGKDDPQQIGILAVDPTGTEANPSPPKNYN